MERTENTPFVNFSLQCLKDNCLKFNRLFPNSKILYSIKANAEDRIIDTVDKMGFGFDVASLGEIYIMKRHKIDSDRIYFSNPTKIPKHISHAKSEGINRFAFDSKMEVEKLSKLAPKSEVYVRIIVNNDGSRWPLKSKFGVDLNEALSLMHYAREMGLLPKGITFHVGSQNLSPKTWTLAIQKSAHLWKMLIREKLMTKDSFINMGGGFPGTYKEKTPPLQQYAKQINSDFSKLFPTETQMIIEPGRSLVADCGYIESTIINIVKRDDNLWLYLDTGVYNGLQEVFEGFEYNITAESKGNVNFAQYIVAGPTCDSVDIIQKNVSLPANLKLGDRVRINSAGAYTTSLEKYNGIAYPKVLFN